MINAIVERITTLTGWFFIPFLRYREKAGNMGDGPKTGRQYAGI